MEGKKSVKKRVLIIVCSVLLIFVAAAGVLLIRNGLKQETYKEAIQTAEKYVAEQNYEDAIVAYENAISAVPDREEPYMGLSVPKPMGNGITENFRFPHRQWDSR